MNAYNYIDELGLGMLLLTSFGRRDWNHGLKCFQDPCGRESRIRSMKRTTGNLIIHSDIVNQNNHTGKIDRKAQVVTRAVRLRHHSPSNYICSMPYSYGMQWICCENNYGWIMVFFSSHFFHMILGHHLTHSMRSHTLYDPYKLITLLPYKRLYTHSWWIGHPTSQVFQKWCPNMSMNSIIFEPNAHFDIE